jgi:hypothetical protein
MCDNTLSHNHFFKSSGLHLFLSYLTWLDCHIYDMDWWVEYAHSYIWWFETYHYVKPTCCRASYRLLALYGETKQAAICTRHCWGRWHARIISYITTNRLQLINGNSWLSINNIFCALDFEWCIHTKTIK